MKTRYVIQFSDKIFGPNKWHDLGTYEYTNNFATRKEALAQLKIERSKDESGEYAFRVALKCEFFIVQARVYTSLDKPRKFRWEHMMCADFSEHGDSELVKRFETREQAEKGIRRYIRKHCYGDYSSNRHRYRIIHCEVVT